MRTPRHRLFLTAILLGILVISGLLAWIPAPKPADPILGRWPIPNNSDGDAFEFRSEGAFIYHVGPSSPPLRGEWRFLPDPYYERAPGSRDIWIEVFISEGYGPPGPIFHPTQMDEGLFKYMLDKGAIRLSPNRDGGRIYQCHFDLGLGTTGSPFFYLLDGPELRSHSPADPGAGDPPHADGPPQALHKRSLN